MIANALLRHCCKLFKLGLQIAAIGKRLSIANCTTACIILKHFSNFVTNLLNQNYTNFSKNEKNKPKRNRKTIIHTKPKSNRNK